MATGNGTVHFRKYIAVQVVECVLICKTDTAFLWIPRKRDANRLISIWFAEFIAVEIGQTGRFTYLSGYLNSCYFQMKTERKVIKL